MDREITVNYTLETIKTSVKRQWINVIGTSGVLLLLILITVFLLLLFFGEANWFFGFFTALLLVYTGIVVFGYFRLRSFSMTRFRRMESPTATFRFTDEGITVAADTGRTEVAWKLVEKVLQTPNVWIILVAGGGITLPTNSLDDGLKTFILERVANNEGYPK